MCITYFREKKTPNKRRLCTTPQANEMTMKQTVQNKWVVICHSKMAWGHSRFAWIQRLAPGSRQNSSFTLCKFRENVLCQACWISECESHRYERPAVAIIITHGTQTNFRKSYGNTLHLKRSIFLEFLFIKSNYLISIPCQYFIIFYLLEISFIDDIYAKHSSLYE